jgi:hypothetical protein
MCSQQDTLLVTLSRMVAVTASVGLPRRVLRTQGRATKTKEYMRRDTALSTEWRAYLSVLLLLHALFERQPSTSGFVNLSPEIRRHSLARTVMDGSLYQRVALTLYVSSGLGTTTTQALRDSESTNRLQNLAHHATAYNQDP